MEPAAGKKADLTADDLNRLPSKKAYAAFDHRYGNCGTYGVNVGDAASQLNSALNSHQNIKNEAEKILKAWCEASSQMTGSYASSSGLCQYFYFWLWDLLKNKLSDTEESPLSVMKTIYEKLNQVSSSSTTTVGGKEMCKIIYDNISDKEFFPQVKIHFDYSKDYLTITTQLGNGVSGGGVGTKACDTTYHDHLEAIKTACSAIEADCKEDSLSPKSGKYCDPLRAAGQQNEVTAGDYCKKEELQKLECQEVPKPKPNPNPNQASSSGSFSDADSGSAASSIAPAAGGLAAIGIPTVLFFLYKYTSAFSLIKDSFFGGSSGRSTNNKSNRIKRRRTTIESDFDDDTLTEDTLTADSSTEYSTLGSTIGSTDELSLFGGSESGGSNNRRGKNIRYQRM